MISTFFPFHTQVCDTQSNNRPTDNTISFWLHVQFQLRPFMQRNLLSIISVFHFVFWFIFVSQDSDFFFSLSFCLLSFFHPIGCEFFRKWKDSGYETDRVLFDWSQVSTKFLRHKLRCDGFPWMSLLYTLHLYKRQKVN